MRTDKTIGKIWENVVVILPYDNNLYVAFASDIRRIASDFNNESEGFMLKFKLFIQLGVMYFDIKGTTIADVLWYLRHYLHGRICETTNN